MADMRKFPNSKANSKNIVYRVNIMRKTTQACFNEKQKLFDQRPGEKNEEQFI